MSGKSADSTSISTSISATATMSRSEGSKQPDSSQHRNPTQPQPASYVSHQESSQSSASSSLPAQRTETTSHNFSTTYVQCPSCSIMATGDQAFCGLCGEPLSTNKDHAAFPTEQRLAAQQRAKEGIQPQKRQKKVEQHFDDCGDDLTPLKVHHSNFEDCPSDDSSVGDAAGGISKVLASCVTHGFQCSESDLPPETHSGMIIAVDFEEAYPILTSRPYGVEIVELCGGQVLTSQMIVRRQLTAGHNFELVTGCDLTNPDTQKKVMAYLSVAKPLVVVMAPRCDPFGPLGRWNRTIHPEGWTRSYRESAPLAKFCGEVALLQIQECRHFLCEQPQTSIDALPRKAMAKNNGAPSNCQNHLPPMQSATVRQWTALSKSNRPGGQLQEIVEPFEGLVCTGDHQHAVLTGGQASKAQKWSSEMCDRIAFGIQQLASSLLNPKVQALPTVAVGSDSAGAGGEPAESSEPWRKCKGCRWRLPKYDPTHSRIAGECRHPGVKPLTLDCPGCVARRPRDHATQTYDEKCRHTVTTARKKVPKREGGRIPTSAEPTSGLRARGMGDADEQAAEERLEEERAPGARPSAPQSSEASGARPAEAAPDAADPPAAGDLQIIPAGEGASGAERRGRGPDQLQRVRRVFCEGEAQTPDPSDWSSFDISASLRGLRLRRGRKKTSHPEVAPKMVACK